MGRALAYTCTLTSPAPINFRKDGRGDLRVTAPAPKRQANWVVVRRIICRRALGAQQSQPVSAFAPRTSPTKAALRARTSERVDPSGHQDAMAIQRRRPPHQR